MFPAGDVGEFVDKAAVEIDEAGNADADGGDVGEGDAKIGDPGGHFVDEGMRAVEVGGGDGFVGAEEFAGTADAEFDRGAAEVDADRRE